MTSWTVHHGDALAHLPNIPARSIGAVITDPPYSSGGAFRGDRLQDVHTKYVQTGSTSNHLADFTGDTRDQRGYLHWSALWINLAARALVPGGVLAVFTDWRQLPTTTDALQAGGIVWRGIVPWHKPNGRRTQGRFANNCEYVVWGANGPRALDTLPGALPGFFQANTPRTREHITQKPLDVMRGLVQICPPGATVLDPFAGSGSTGVAALVEGRSFVGIEMSEHFVHVAEQRLESARAETWQQPAL